MAKADAPPQEFSVELPPLHPHQFEVIQHPARFKVLCCGRRWGKSRLGSAYCTAVALHGGRAWWVAPSYKVARVGWRMIKELCRQIPYAIIRESELMVEFPWCDGYVQVRSADDPNSLRGDGLDLAVLDECAYIVEEAFTYALRAALSDRRGSALFISTPAGQNWFWNYWCKGQDDAFPDWMSWQFSSYTNPFLAHDEIDGARDLLPERVFQQEYLAEFLEEAGGVFRGVKRVIDPTLVGNQIPRPELRYYMGIDLARVNDFTVLNVLNHLGKQVYWDRFNQISWERQIDEIVRVATRYRPHIVMDSTGVGQPLYEILQKRLKLPITPYHLSNPSKTALIDNLAIKIEHQEIALMDNKVQTNEILAYQYKITPNRTVTMSAPQGLHDDCVISLAMAAWKLGALQAVRRSRRGRAF